MTTILIVGNSEGSRRCDARCHTAKEPACDCCCGGRYHGVGSSARAQEMLTEDWFGPEWREKFERAGVTRPVQAPAQEVLL